MVSKNSNKKKSNIDAKWILPVLHFIATFIFEKIVLIPERAEEVFFSVPLNETFSVRFEQIMCYAFSKIMAMVIIFFLWKLLFCFFDRKIDKEVKILFGTLMAVSVLQTVILWPGVFEAGGDNFIPFSYAIRLMPEYWHGFYLTCLYVASIMVFPHAISINVLQTILFVAAIGYVYNRIKQSEVIKNTKWIRFLTLPMFFFADSFTVATNPERAEYNASLTLIFVSIILFDIIEQKKRNRVELASLLIFAGFLSVFRSEGIIVAIPGFIVLLFFVYKPNMKKAAPILLALLAAHLVFSLPSKVGEVKYYGNDYSIINSFNSLHNILCSDKSNLNYEGADSNLEAIQIAAPIEAIKEFSSEGYRRYNFSKGYADINQSRLSKEDSEAFLSAYKAIVIHNLPIYLKTQWHMFISAIGVQNAEYIEEYKGDGSNLSKFDRTLWSVGEEDYQVIPGRYSWTNNGIRNSLAAGITIPRLNYIDVLKNSGIYTVLFVLEILGSTYVVIDGIVKLCKKRYSELGPSAIALILLGYILLMSLVMPVGANMYFHAYIYCMYVVLIVFLSNKLNESKK